MIRTLLVDDHPALRTGLTAVLRSEPGIVPLDAVETAREVWPALTRTRPDVVLLDYHLPDADGLVLCRAIKRHVPAPAVILYSAYAGAGLTIPALLAGADGMVSKGAPATELFEAIRRAARGERILPGVAPEQLRAAHDRLPTEDLPLLGMSLDGTSPRDMAEALGVDVPKVLDRLDRMIEALAVEVPVG